MATGRMNQLVVLVNLCSSVVEGIEHLMTYKGNERLKEDAVSGLLTLEENLKGFEADQSVIHETKWMAEAIRNWLFVYDQEFQDRLYRWYFIALKELRNLMFAEIETCPVCSGKGTVQYGASIYMEGDEKGKGLLEPVRVYMKCMECGNYYLAREEPRIVKRKQRARRTRVRCMRILSDIKALVPNGPFLFIGVKNSPLYKQAAMAGYEFCALSPEEFLTVKDKDMYDVILIDRIADSRDMRTILETAAERLEKDGILWFDGPDLDKAMGYLEKKGTPIWKEAAAEVCLSKTGIENLMELCKLKAVTIKRVGTTLGRIEVFAKVD